MKNTKKIAFLCIAINIILLLQLCFGTVIALEEEAAYVEPEQIVEEAVIEAQGGEMQIMAASGCGEHKCTYGEPVVTTTGTCTSSTPSGAPCPAKTSTSTRTCTYTSCGSSFVATNTVAHQCNS